MDSLKPKVSIIIVATQPNNLSVSLQSCLNQTYKKIEIIVVGVSEESLSESRIEDDNAASIIYLKAPKDKRLGALLNLGFSKASGDYFTWIYDRTQFLPQAIEELVNFLHRNAQVDFVYADYFKQKNNSDEKILQVMPGYLNFASDNVLSPCLLYTKKVHRGIGPYNPAYETATVFEYNIRISRKFSMRRHPYSLAVTIEPIADGRKPLTPYSHLCRSFLRYKNKFWNFRDLQASLVTFFDWMRNISGGRKQFAKRLFKTALKFYSLSFRFGLWFSVYLPYVLLKRKLLIILSNPSFAWVKDTVEKLKIKFLETGLNSPCAGTNILCLVPDMVVGGSEKVVWDIVSGSKPNGYHFHLLAVAGEDNDWCWQFQKEFRNVVLIPRGFNNYNLQLDQEYYKYLKIMAEKLAIDILLISNAPPAYRVLEKFKQEFPHIKIMDIIHVEEFGGAADGTLSAVPLIDKRVCISQGLKQHILNKYRGASLNGTYAGRITVIHNGNDMEKYSPAKAQKGRFKEWHQIHPNTKLITYIGRFSAEKRPNLFVDIAREVITKSPHTEKLLFVMAGDGPTFKVAEERIKHYNLEDHLLLLGMINSYQIKDLLADSFMVVIPSAIEGLPLIMIEAMAMEVPVVCTDVGSVREGLVHESTGFVVHPQEGVVEHCTDIIFRLLSSPDLYDFLCRNTRGSIVEKFSLSTMANRYREVFQELS